MTYGYYPGCSLHATAKEFNISMRAVCKAFNIELTEVEDWNCCGATPGHTTKEELGLALPYSNLINASKQGLDNIVAPCAACYNRLKSADYSVNNSPLVKERMSQIIGEEKQRDVKIFNVLEFFRDVYGLDKLKIEVQKPLSNLNAACYYGCLLVRPSKVLQFDDEEDPQSMDQIMQTLGAKTVDWSSKTECCGGSHAIPETEIVLELARRIFSSAVKAGADCIVVACPLCHSNLDMRQKQINARYGTNFDLPVFYITELIGLALNISPKDLGMNAHFVDTKIVIEKIG
ncbi:MAG: CoB--CoM heterodisulfide reductase iron-sulfur subunit B family protein [Bacteroidota bacterium]|nr:CoB--CoM heterodisulfide reductase iron-sulfur subunit B family protein [Bacteroidota bacterium]